MLWNGGKGDVYERANGSGSSDRHRAGDVVARCWAEGCYVFGQKSRDCNPRSYLHQSRAILDYDVAWLTELSAADRGIGSLDGLLLFPELEYVNLTDTSIATSAGSTASGVIANFAT